MKPADLAEITQLRHALHRYPELSMREKETKQTIMRFIRERTSCRLVDKGDWFYCVFGEDRPGERIAFRAEMDALPIGETIDLTYASVRPGVSHKCGHDGHAAALCGLALSLEESGTDRPVYLIFQPGEEIGAGGKLCAALLREEEIDRVYAWHNQEGYPAGAVVLRRGLAHPASEGLTLRFAGRCSHASEPEKGINPAGAMAETLLFTQEHPYLEGSLSYSQKRQYRGMVLCTPVGMRAGTGDFGISAGEGELCFTLRAEHEEELALLEKDFLAFAEKVAARDGLTLFHEISDYFPETRNDDAALSHIREAAGRLGFPILEMEQGLRSSEDFGYYTKQTRGAIFYIGTGETWPALHTTAYDFNDGILGIAVDMMAALAKEQRLTEQLSLFTPPPACTPQ